MKLGFRKYLELEQLKKNLIEASEGSEFPEKVFSCLSLVSDSENSEKDDWGKTVTSLIRLLNGIRVNDKLPLIKDAPKGKSNPSEWDYDGREWAMWSNILCKAYSWSLEYVAELDFNEALALIQEILTDEQLEREFLYSLSEIAYPYNKSTKKSNFKPMPRPYWMRPAFKEMKKVKIRRSLLPVGEGIDATGLPAEFGIKNYLNVQNKTEKINPPSGP